jgi:hypothetical protein
MSTWLPPVDYDDSAQDDEELYYRPWGFTIYRTSYQPPDATSAQWETLCAKIVEQMKAEIDRRAKPGEEQLAARLKNAFFLRKQSDPNLWQDKSVPELRVLHLRDARAQGEAPEGPLFPEDEEGHENDDEDMKPRFAFKTYPHPELFLLADAEVLEGPSRDGYFWIKCVFAEFDEYLERNPLFDRSQISSPDGWFRMTTYSVVDLCLDMPGYQTVDLPPQISREWDIYNGELTGVNPADSMCSGK